MRLRAGRIWEGDVRLTSGHTPFCMLSGLGGGILKKLLMKMNLFHSLRIGLLAALFVLAAPGAGRAEIVERELGTNAAGEPVTGYVFQAPRGFSRSRNTGLSLRGRTVRDSSLRRDRDRYRSSRGIDHGYPAWAWQYSLWSAHLGCRSCLATQWGSAPCFGTVIVWQGGY